MPTENKNQVTLYRFVSLRSPELSKKDDQEKRFVFHPDNKTGKFFDAVKNKPTSQTNWEAMQNASTTFVAFQNENEIESLNFDFYKVSEWIARNRSDFDSKELFEKIKSLAIFDLKTEQNLWDNLFYQVITQKSFYVKEAIMQVLVLQNLLKQIKNLDEETIINNLSILANAKVVLPKYLFGAELNDTSVLAKGEIEDKEIVLDKELYDAQLIQSAKNNIDNLDTLIEELQTLEKNYYKDYQKRYSEEIKNYQDQVFPIFEAYQKEYDIEKRKLCDIPRDEHYDPNDICYQPDVETPDVPEFVFNYPSEFDIKEIETQLSKENFELLTQLISKNKVATFQEAIDLASKKMKKENTIISQRIIASEKTIAIGDTIISTSKTFPTSSEIPFQICSTRLGNGNVSIYMSIPLPNTSYNIDSLNYTLHYSTGINNTNGNYIKTWNGNVMTLSKLFNDGIAFSLNSVINGISGNIKFTNGQEFTFLINPFSLLDCYPGKLIKKNGEDSGGENPSESNTFIPKGFGYRQLGIADYKKVVAEVCCYDAGEVAHIENVMASELRSKVSTKSFKSEVTDFESTEIEKENMTDVISTERFEMQTEVAKLLAQQKQFSAYADVHTSWGNTSLDAGMAYASNTTKEESNRQAINQAKELTQRAVERIVSRVRTEKTVKITNEYVEENTHAFDNRGNSEHISGVFRFINAIYKNQIFNYGKRLMYEFTVPQPSKLHRLAMKVAKNNENTVVLDKPINPVTLGITDFTKINSTNYQSLSSKYGVEVDVYPSDYVNISQHFLKEDWTNSGRWHKSGEFVIKLPENYSVELVKGYFDPKHGDHSATWNNMWGTIYIGTKKISIPARTHDMPIYVSGFDTEIEKELSITLTTWDIATYNFNLIVKCKLTLKAKEEWQKRTYESIVKGYQEQLRIYNEKVSEAKANGVQILDSNPLFYRQIEQTVLRKNCISYFLDNSTTSSRRFGKKMYTGDSIMNHQVTANQAMDDYGSFAKFMEQAFEWNLMSYNFYPYYWGYDGDWTELYQHETNDPIFRSFMQAGMARVVVTVKPGFEEAVMHYMTTGQIWNGGQTPILGDPLYLSIVDELKEQEYTVEETWKTVVPTHLIALQKSGVALDVEGLPCECPAIDELNKKFIPNANTLIAKAE